VKYEYSQEHADRVLRFFRTQIRYVEGRKAGKPFIPEPWQEKLLRDLFGWIRPDGTRRYRMAYIEVPRKNGKSTLSAGIALYLLLADGENRPQVYSAAGDRSQARVVFNTAREMVLAHPKLQQVGDLRQYEIRNIRKGGWYEALSAEAASVHGRSVHGAIFDEVHVQKDRRLWDGLVTGISGREQPLIIAITTAGHDRSSICWELHQRAKAAIAEPEADPSFYGAIWGAEPNEDWTDEAVWAKANPNLGISVNIEYLREMCQAAKDNPEAENTFRNLHLDQWTQQAVRWIQMHLWDKCRRDFDESDLEGQLCFAAIDLASTRDATALALLFPQAGGTYRVLPYFWIPEDSKSDRTHQDRRQMLNWAAKGLIRTTEGNTADHYKIAADLAELRERFDIQLCAFDPWSPSLPFVQICKNECGMDETWFRDFRQTPGNYSAPCKEFERLISSERLHHNGNPVLQWMAGNIAACRDNNDNIKPDKKASADKIDGIVATIMALGLAIVEPSNESVYAREHRGFLTIG
jgi:phage terminase large subunit-like protein